jgi:hypothetical protein
MNKGQAAELEKLARYKQHDAVFIKAMQFYDATRILCEDLNFYEIALIVVYVATLIFLLVGFF